MRYSLTDRETTGLKAQKDHTMTMHDGDTTIIDLFNTAHFQSLNDIVQEVREVIEDLLDDEGADVETIDRAKAFGIIDNARRLELLDNHSDYLSMEGVQSQFDEVVDEMDQMAQIILRGDSVALREAYNNFADSLCQDGQIHVDVYDAMDNPY